MSTADGAIQRASLQSTAVGGPTELAVMALSAKRTARTQKIAPRGLRREAAADYVGVSPSAFDLWVKNQIMPQSKRIGGVVLWDRFALDAHLEALFYPEADPNSVWDNVF